MPVLVMIWSSLLTFFGNLDEIIKNSEFVDERDKFKFQLQENLTQNKFQAK